MKNLQSNNRIAIFDYIKAVAMLLVIYNHCVIGTLHRNELGYPFFVMLPVPILMYLSGYTFSKSFEKYGGGERHSFVQYYSFSQLTRKYSRFILPMIPIYMLRVLKNAVVDHDTVNLLDVVLKFFVAGNGGPGSYYFSTVLLLVALFPILYLIIKKGKEWGLFFLFLTNLVYDMLCWKLEMSYDIYRNLLFQYTFIVSCGIYSYLYHDKIKKWHMVLSAVIGFIYIVFTSYLGVIPKIIPFRYDTAWPIGFWVFPIMNIFLSKFYYFRLSNEHLNNAICAIGKASYHIFCVQLLWFVSSIEKKISNNLVIQMGVSFVFCIVIGWVYYNFEQWLRIKLDRNKKIAYI